MDYDILVNFDACCTSEHTFFSGFKLKKACMLYMPVWYTHRYTVYWESFRNVPVHVPSHEIKGYQILHVALSSGPPPRVPKFSLSWPSPVGSKF